MESTDARLFTSAAEGDADSLARLLGEYGPVVRRRLRIDPIWQAILDPADVMQVTYLEAFLRIDQLQARTPESFVAWLTQLAQNNLRDGIKELERQKRPNPHQRVRRPNLTESATTLLNNLCTAPSKTPSRAASAREVQQMLVETLARLPAPYAEVLRLYDLEGRTTADVAVSMGRSKGAVCMLRLRALERLRSLLGSASRFFSSGA